MALLPSDVAWVDSGPSTGELTKAPWTPGLSLDKDRDKAQEGSSLPVGKSGLALKAHCGACTQDRAGRGRGPARLRPEAGLLVEPAGEGRGGEGPAPASS